MTLVPDNNNTLVLSLTRAKVKAILTIRNIVVMIVQQQNRPTHREREPYNVDRDIEFHDHLNL